LLDDIVESTRARLDPVEVFAAAAEARRKSIDELISELIIQPAQAAGASWSTIQTADDS
jgi:ribosomal protein L12E/L44/L45/RPP1/RPP2